MLHRDSIASSASSSVLETDNAVKIKLEKLRRELDVIQSKVMEEREKYVKKAILCVFMNLHIFV